MISAELYRKEEKMRTYKVPTGGGLAGASGGGLLASGGGLSALGGGLVVKPKNVIICTNSGLLAVFIDIPTLFSVRIKKSNGIKLYEPYDKY